VATKGRSARSPCPAWAANGRRCSSPTTFEETAREWIIRYAGRNRIEDGLGISVNFFHLDCLASEVRLNVDLDAMLTVIANGCYRWRGHGSMASRSRLRSNCTVDSWRPLAR
jgi:hypothetical protein